MSRSPGVLLRHPNGLAAAVAAVVFLQFALNRGGSDQAIWVAGLLLALQGADPGWLRRTLSRRALVVLGVAALLLLTSWALFPQVTDTHRSLRIVRFLVLVLAVRQLAHQPPDRGWLWLALLVSSIVLWQLGARHLAGHPFGAFENPHYLAYFSSLLWPALVILVVQLEPPYRWLVAAVLLLNLDPILNILWAPTIPLVANAAGAALLVWTVAGRRVRWGLSLGALALVAAVAFLLATHRFVPIGQPVPVEGGDERVQIWGDTARMIATGDRLSWLVGHGIGSFQEDFPRFSAPAYRDFALPHNHFLELLYENGLAGLGLVLVGLGYVLVKSLRLAGALGPAGLRWVARCNLAALAVWFCFSFLAFGVYSRYTLYPFAILLGIHLFLSDQLDDQVRAQRRPHSGDGGLGATPGPG